MPERKTITNNPVRSFKDAPGISFDLLKRRQMMLKRNRNEHADYYRR